MTAGTLTWIGYIIVRTGNFQEIADSMFYTAAAYGGIVSFLSYVLVTILKRGKIKEVRLPSEYPGE